MKYLNILINSSIFKANKVPKEELFKNKQNEVNSDNTVALVPSFNPRESKLFQIINTSREMLKDSEKMNKILNQTKLVLTG